MQGQRRDSAGTAQGQCRDSAGAVQGQRRGRDGDRDGGWDGTLVALNSGVECEHLLGDAE